MKYDVLIQPQPGDGYRATALGWPDLNVSGDGERAVIEQICEAIQARLTEGKIVHIEMGEEVARSRRQDVG